MRDREEVFEDLVLGVQGNATLNDSLREYVAKVNTFFFSSFFLFAVAIHLKKMYFQLYFYYFNVYTYISIYISIYLYIYLSM